MFVCNVKINGNKVFKAFIFFACILMIILFIWGLFRIFGPKKGEIKDHDAIISTDITNIEAKNYTNMLKAVHENVNNYIGCKIHFSGYIYRVYDFTESQFVLARDMVINSDMQTLIVGFLCNSSESIKYEDGTWVELTGEITKGNYHGEMPEIKVTEIKETTKPEDAYVYPPDETYIPTDSVL